MPEQQQQPVNLDALIDAAAAGRPQAQAQAPSNDLDSQIEAAGTARQRTLSPQQATAEPSRQPTLALNALKAGTGGLMPIFGQPVPSWAQPEKVPGPPLTPWERYGYGMLSALPVAATIGAGEIATGGGITAPLIGVGSQMLGAAAGEAANEFMPNVPYAPEIAGLLAGFAGVPVANIAREAESTAAAAAAGARSAEQTAQAQAAAKAAKDHQEAIRRLYTDPVDGLLAKEESAAEAEAAANRQQISNTTDTGVRQAETQISDVAANLHPTIATEQEFGKSAQEIARNWWNVVKPQKIAQYAQDLYSRLPTGTAVADVPAPINNLAASLRGINTTAGTLEPLAQALKPRLGAQLYRTFESEFESPAATRSVEGLPEQGVAARPSEPVTLSDLLQLRTALGDAMADSRITSDIGKDNVKRLYAAASADAGAALQEVGVNPRYWNEYNEKTSRLYNLAENTVSDIISTGKAAEETILPENIASKIPDKGGSWLEAIRSEPELAAIADNYAAHTIRGKVASGTIEHKSGGEGSANAWRGLSPEAQAAMIPDPAQRAQLNAAIASREELPQKGEELLAQVEAQKMARVQAVKDAHNIAAEKARQQVYDTQVPGKAPQPQGAVGNMADRIQEALSGNKVGITGLAASAGGAYTLAHQLGFSPEMLPTVAAASATLPWVAKQGARALKSLAQSPGNVRFPVYGLVGGETADNRLMPK